MLGSLRLAKPPCAASGATPDVSSSCRQGEDYTGAAAGDAVEIDATRMSLDDASRQRQAEPDTVRFCGEERPKRATCHPRRHPDAGILDCDLDRSVISGEIGRASCRERV